MPSTRSVIYPLDYNKNTPDYNSWAQYIYEENVKISMSETQKLEVEIKAMDRVLKSAKKLIKTT